MNHSNLQFFLHYFLHLVFPFIIARIFAGKEWKKAGIIMFLTLLVDTDHLLSDPVFNAERCSINFHILHSYPAIAIYFAGLFYKKTRWLATGLLIHMLTDTIDCIWMYKHCNTCIIDAQLQKALSVLHFN